MLSLYYDGGECSTWSGIRAGHPFRAFFLSILVRGDTSGVPRSIDRNRVTTSIDRYGSVYPCTAGSGSICIVRCVPAPASSAAAGRWGVVPGLETGRGGGGGVRSPAPACVWRRAVRRSPVPVDWWVGLCDGGVGAVRCHSDMDW